METNERAAKNEALFREVNERIKGVSEAFAFVDRGPIEFVCECGRAGCTEPIELTLAEYERVRRDLTHFALAPGHVDPDKERTIEEHDRFTVVEKHLEDERRIVVENDPRS